MDWKKLISHLQTNRMAKTSFKKNSLPQISRNTFFQLFHEMASTYKHEYSPIKKDHFSCGLKKIISLALDQAKIKSIYCFDYILPYFATTPISLAIL